MNTEQPKQQPGQQPGKPIEEKHLADEEQGRPAPSAHPERPPQHQPGFEAKQKAEEAKKAPKDEHKNEHEALKPRSQPARRKPEVRRAKIRKHK
jgi:hypothetical protein